MNMYPESKERKEGEALARPPEGTEKGEEDVCADIADPVRRGLCRICQAPVVGEAPFCKDHEPPVP
jgi:hypothetical protein